MGQAQEVQETRRSEPFSEPTLMCGQLLLSGGQRSAGNRLRACFALAQSSMIGTWHATGVEQRSRKGGSDLPAQRTLPQASDAVAFLRPVITGHTQVRDSGIGTPEHRLVS